MRRHICHITSALRPLETADIAGAFVTPTALELEEDGDSKIFGMQLTSEPLGTVKVHFDIDDPAAATLSKTVLTFGVWNWDMRQEVTVSPVDDNIITGDRESYIVFKVASSTADDDAYNGLRLLNSIKVCEKLDQKGVINDKMPNKFCMREASCIAHYACDFT